nr:disease resistance protein RGA5-like [Lolium perenne]
MAGIMVSASTGVMNSLLGKLATLMGDEFAKLKNLRKEVKYIRDELSSMKDALESLAYVDELDKQTAGWRDAVREMSYDIEDIIDDFMCKVGEKSKKSGFVHDTIQRLKTSRARHQIAGQIEGIKKLVRETSERRERYKLDVPRPGNVAVDQRVVALYENAAKLVGIEGPTNELVGWLNGEEKQLKVVSIVGFGGLGKTTLANRVYHKLDREFQCGAFVPVSQKPNMSKLLHSLLTQLGCGQPFHDCELNVLLDQVRENLKQKRYLVIIDDLWDVSAWNIIKCAFPENNLGSRLIVTTRIKTLAEACCFGHHEHILEMKPLSEEDSRKLFLGRIFGSEEACSGQLRDVSVEILKKCGGLPLAIISISSLLASESSNQKERWKDAQNSLVSVSGTNLTLESMRQILNLSYKNLPHHLKTCFLYLGMFPEDSEIYRHELPVQIDMHGSVITCKVHDMLLDLILYKSAEENFITVLENPEAIIGQLQKPRRMLFNLDGATLPRDISDKRLRWFDTLHTSIGSIKGLGELTNLRVLYLRTGFSEAVDMDVLNSSLGKLCNLYSLNIFSPDSWIPEALTLSPPPPNLMSLSMMRISRVPNWIGVLHNLQSLHINVDKLEKDDVGILAELPALIDLELTFNRALEERIVIYGTSFASLKRFVVYWIIMPHLTFRAGAMPKLQRLSLHLNARGWKQDESTTPTVWL